MHISKVTYSQLFPVGLYLNERVGVEIDVNPGEDAMKALEIAKALTVDFNKKNSPQPEEEKVIQLNKEKETEKNRLYELMKDCTTREELHQYSEIASQQGMQNEWETLFLTLDS
jgi:hypothetical protein